MNIEFEYNPKRIELLDHVIRDMSSVDEDGNRLEKSSHLQLRCRELTKKYEGSISVSITYKDEESRFLGLDEGSTWKNSDDSKKVIPITIPISVPQEASKAICIISVAEESGWFYPLSGKVAVLLGLTFLASIIYKVLASGDC